MFSKEIIIELDKIDTIVNWEVISDFHMGNANWQEDLATRRLNAILDDPYRFTSFGGDQLDLILPKDPRFKDESVRLATKAEQMSLMISLKSYSRNNNITRIIMVWKRFGMNNGVIMNIILELWKKEK